jgi:outer membrane protein assembly factor BamE (lipoprotein component of BamABCDE complex)
MRRRTVLAVVVLLLFFCALLGTLLWQGMRNCYDATICAPGFSESKFKQIRHGMSKADVTRVLGKPLSNVEGLSSEQNRWFYSFLDRTKIPEDDRVTNTWYRARTVEFDGHGLVDRTVSSAERFE